MRLGSIFKKRNKEGGRGIHSERKWAELPRMDVPLPACMLGKRREKGLPLAKPYVKFESISKSIKSMSGWRLVESIRCTYSGHAGILPLGHLGGLKFRLAEAIQDLIKLRSFTTPSVKGRFPDCTRVWSWNLLQARDEVQPTASS